ncbi:hypothetical protein NV377_16475 [Paenibacillus sp. T3-5-0-4]|nr:hypothetical protein [Paenibacillus endoradicis]
MLTIEIFERHCNWSFKKIASEHVAVLRRLFGGDIGSLENV